MDRVSGWYKRSSQLILLLLGLAMAMTLNINTIHIGSMLFHDRTARELIVASAQKTANTEQMTYVDASNRLGNLDTLIGWHNGVWSELRQNGPSDVSGWLLTAFAVSFGAPFWFDLLNRLIVVRSTVKPHQKSPEESSVDRQTNDPDPVPSTPAPFQAGAPSASEAQLARAVLPSDPVLPSLTPGPDTDQDGGDVDMAGNITTDEMLPAAAGGLRR